MLQSILVLGGGGHRVLGQTKTASIQGLRAGILNCPSVSSSLCPLDCPFFENCLSSLCLTQGRKSESHSMSAGPAVNCESIA